jgi:hypothetical protein
VEFAAGAYYFLAFSLFAIAIVAGFTMGKRVTELRIRDVEKKQLDAEWQGKFDDLVRHYQGQVEEIDRNYQALMSEWKADTDQLCESYEAQIADLKQQAENREKDTILRLIQVIHE